MVKSHDDAARPENEFSRRVLMARVPEGGLAQTIEADAKERAALARRFDLVSLDRLCASIRIEPVRGTPLWRLSGTLSGDAVQRCVVTLEPLPAHIEDSFDELYAPPAHVETLEREAAETESEEFGDIPEPLEDGGIDVGEVVAQYFSLALDPAPRKEGAMEIRFVDAAEEGEATGLEKENPFAALKKLKGEGT
jgi:uncharacterized metal-binding protein YceD (DUF177 family)